MTISLVIPCRNEAPHLAEIIADVPRTVDEILLVNNGSTDNTLHVMRQLARKNKKIRVIDESRHKKGVGYGYACVAGMNAATGTYIVCMDGDGTYPMRAISSLVAHAQKQKKDLVVASRYSVCRKPYLSGLKIGTWLLNICSALLFGRYLSDVVSGMWVIKKSALPKLKLREGDWNLSLEIKLKTLMTQGLSIDEHSIAPLRRFGESKQQYIKTGLRHVGWLLRYRVKTWSLRGSLVLGVTLLSLISFMYFYGGLFSVDTSSYGKIAEYYAAFDFDKAINGYWSPLISWLLVPFIWFGIDFFVGMRLIVAMAVLILMYSLVVNMQQRFLQRAKPQASLMLAVALSGIGVLFAYWAARTPTPDVLSGLLATAALAGTIALFRRPTMIGGVGAGILWSLVFFAKSFGVFVALAAIGAGLLWLLAARRLTLRHLKATMVLLCIFAVALASWSTAIYMKYGEFSLTMTSRNNFNLIGPEAKRHHQIDYQDVILEPPYPESTSAWDDPSQLSPKAWDLHENTEYYVQHVKMEFTKALHYLLLLGPLVVGAIVLCIIRYRSIHTWILLGVLGVTIVGYSLLFIELRYLYIVAIPLLFFAVSTTNWQMKRTYIMAVLLTLGSLVQVGYQIYTYQNTAAYLRGFRSFHTAVAADIPQGSRIAIQSIDTIAFCYYARSSCVGMGFKLASRDLGNQEKIEKMKRASIHYLLTRSPVDNDAMELIGEYRDTKRYCLQGLHVVSCGEAYILLYRIQ